MGLKNKFENLITEISLIVREREDEVRNMVLALLAGEHLFLGGPPGIAKSMLARLLTDALDGGSIFDYLLTRFTQPEELFGPFSMKAIKQDEYKRSTAGTAVEAEVLFLDEVFKANSACLNTLLTLINERVFHNGTDLIETPLVMVLGASNELPQGSDLEAFADRFLFKHWCADLQDDQNFMAVISGEENPELPDHAKISQTNLTDAQDQASLVTVTDKMLEFVADLRRYLREQGGFEMSSRRWKKYMKVARASAWLDGRDEVSEDDFLGLADVMWREPNQRPELMRLLGKKANPSASEATELLDAAKGEFRRVPFNDTSKMKPADLFELLTEVNTAFVNSLKRLSKLNGCRQVKTATTEINRMHRETTNLANRVMKLA